MPPRATTPTGVFSAKKFDKLKTRERSVSSGSLFGANLAGRAPVVAQPAVTAPPAISEDPRDEDAGIKRPLSRSPSKKDLEAQRQAKERQASADADVDNARDEDAEVKDSGNSELDEAAKEDVCFH